MEEYYFESIPSTQDYAKQLCRSGKNDFIVWAKEQVKGRGRLGRVWKAPAGGLWFSFDVDVSNVKTEMLTIFVGVAVREVLSELYKCELKLKWPNDLILKNKKVGGIICEKFENQVVIGIGINTNVDKVDEVKAITFQKETGIKVDNNKLMNEIVLRCKKMFSEETGYIIKKFRDNMAYKGEMCYVSALNEQVKILDISEKGHLIVDTKEGEKEVFVGEINLCT